MVFHTLVCVWRGRRSLEGGTGLSQASPGAQPMPATPCFQEASEALGVQQEGLNVLGWPAPDVWTWPRLASS